MASLVARAVLCLIFGFFIYETINEFNKLFGVALNPYFAIVPAVLVYVVEELMIKKLRAHEKTVPINKSMELKIDKVYYFIAWIFVAIFFFGVFVVWAEVIYKQLIREYADYTTTVR